MTTITLQLPDELLQRLQTASREAGMPLDALIVTTLSQAISRREVTSEPSEAVREETRRIREALGDLVVDNPEEWVPEIEEEIDFPDRQTDLDFMPKLDPPLSATLIEDRDDRI